MKSDVKQRLEFREGEVLFAGHFCLGFRCFVTLAGEVKDAVDEDAAEFGIEGDLSFFGVRTDGVERDENIAVECGGGGVVEGDDVGVVIMAEELAVDLQFTLV